jgi:hypothetical protein
MLETLYENPQLFSLPGSCFFNNRYFRHSSPSTALLIRSGKVPLKTLRDFGSGGDAYVQGR